MTIRYMMLDYMLSLFAYIPNIILPISELPKHTTYSHHYVDLSMNAIAIAEEAAELEEEAKESVESIRTDSFSLEVMRFEPGDEDPMHAHAEEEIYHVDSGAGKINVEGDITPVSSGDVIHLEPGTDHQFLEFEDELVMSVLYAPAKGANQ
jgi:Uncharacterized conserved protein, contains double-stranded beta-helix domain